jgi:hypothetical protein
MVDAVKGQGSSSVIDAVTAVKTKAEAIQLGTFPSAETFARELKTSQLRRQQLRVTLLTQAFWFPGATNRELTNVMAPNSLETGMVLVQAALDLWRGYVPDAVGVLG